MLISLPIVFKFNVDEEDEDATEGDDGEEAAVDETGKFDGVTTDVET